ncbi:gamma-glutamyl-gamma-aminobutyrate hydrolase family protein [Miniphocaeibacter halophilus]|uniref:Gamma-glutamyl-gamma-aminobutyrate hydrolase family protein n=1 Tax=Miniphocaeibacter halophilus TaxID=2931922 RepID=A0AC61MSH3_9FIRM|nr:gamma-glutamyl-gamma-aminobutyrate hydrolase family protein [Miniphocaeibacter halophilus]QQK08605.1 gamma-glutamyl-gamma-aminobutyrate hydrolase family protein [Miniphocaeibacter halophilus]
MKKYKIGIVGGVNRGSFANLLYAKESYIKTIVENQQIPIILPITKDKNIIESLIKKVDGLIFQGGVNIYPFHYGENPKTEILNFDLDRDYSEFSYLEMALKYKKPVLGVSRGCQLINVFFGGSLIQDISKEIQKSIYHIGRDYSETRHYINLRDGSKLKKAYNTNRTVVVSSHTQAIDVLGKDLVVSAKADDGVVEAIEYKGNSYLMGVQFNIDRMLNEESKLLFNQFIESAGIQNE